MDQLVTTLNTMLGHCVYGLLVYGFNACTLIMHIRNTIRHTFQVHSITFKSLHVQTLLNSRHTHFSTAIELMWTCPYTKCDRETIILHATKGYDVY